MISIKEPWWGAGKKFGWSPLPGVGIAEPNFRGEGDMEIEILHSSFKGKVFKISKVEAIKIVKQHNSLDFRMGVKLGVLPIHKLQDETNPVETPKADRQRPLL